MFDEKFRAVLSENTLVKILIRELAKRKITPNQLTVTGFVFSVLACLFLVKNLRFFSLAFWFLSRFLDGLDGILARETDQKTGFGAYLDILLDMFAYSLYLIVFACKHSEYYLLWLLLLLGYLLCITSTLSLSSLLEQKPKTTSLKKTNRSFFFTTGFAEAGETTIIYTLFIFFPEFIFYLGVFWLILVYLTIIQRTYLASKD